MFNALIPHALKFLVFCVMTAAYSYLCYSNGYDKGYAVKTAEYQTAYEQALAEKTAYYVQAIANNRKIVEKDAEDRYNRLLAQQEIKVITEKVIEYVDREIEVPTGCTDLAKSVNGLLIDTTRNIARITTSTETDN